MKKFSLILSVLLIVISLGCAFPGIVFAASETIYSDVLEDLGKDETFDASEYLDPVDNSLEIIQIAESNAGELFLYVHQPSDNKFDATSVNISTAINESLHYENYKLTKLSKQGNLGKYIVNGFEVKNDTVRYYDVSAIFRKWYEDVDAKTDTNNTVSEVSFAVGKLYTACTMGDTVTYTEVHQDTLEVIAKYVGNLRYYDGGKWVEDYYTTSHYVAFSTDIPIDTIFEADVKYDISHYKLIDENRYAEWDNLSASQKETEDKQSLMATLHSNEYDSNNPQFKYLSHTWKTIQSVSEFIKTEKIKDSAIEQLKNKQWVLRFATSKITRIELNPLNGVYDFYEVSDVTILRLKFMTAGKIYNLGVVDNKQTGSNIPSNIDQNDPNDILARIGIFFDWLIENWWVIVVGIIVIALIVSL